MAELALVLQGISFEGVCFEHGEIEQCKTANDAWALMLKAGSFNKKLLDSASRPLVNDAVKEVLPDFGPNVQNSKAGDPNAWMHRMPAQVAYAAILEVHRSGKTIKLKKPDLPGDATSSSATSTSSSSSSFQFERKVNMDPTVRPKKVPQLTTIRETVDQILGVETLEERLEMATNALAQYSDGASDAFDSVTSVTDAGSYTSVKYAISTLEKAISKVKIAEEPPTTPPTAHTPQWGSARRSGVRAKSPPVTVLPTRVVQSRTWTAPQARYCRYPTLTPTSLWRHELRLAEQMPGRRLFQ